MAFVKQDNSEVVFKICLYGVRTADTFRALEVIAATVAREPIPARAPPSAPENMRMLELSLGELRGCNVQVHLYAGPMETHPSHRLLVLKGSDGAIFVASPDRTADLERAEELQHHVESLGLPWGSFGVAVLGTAPAQLAVRESFAVNLDTGNGVMSAVKSISKQVLTTLRGA